MALKGLQDGFELIISSSPNALIVVNEDGKIVLVNPRAEQLFLYRADELIGQDIETLLPERFRKGHIPLRSTFIKRKETRQMGAGRDLYGLRRDGKEVPVEVGLATIESGNRVFVLASIIDITIRKESETQLKEYQLELERVVEEKTGKLKQAYRFLDSIIENIPDMIFVKDAKDLRFVRFNKAGEELLGYARQSLVGKGDYDFFPRAEADFFTSQDRLALEKKSILDIPEETVHTREKGDRILHTKKIPIQGEHGQPEYILGISEDITEKRRNEKIREQLLHEQIEKEEAQKALHLRDDFISIASHELKTPLTALRMQLEMIPQLLRKTSFPWSDKLSAFIRNSLHQLDLFLKLVNELLDVSRISSGHFVLEKHPVNMSETLSRMIDQYRNELSAAGCPVSTDLDASIQGNWDPIRIEQVIVNLLTNAMKYGAGKPIEIVTRVRGDLAVLSIRDHGIGIEKKDQSQIFERFERAVPVTKYGGLGLGLYISRQIVESHHGTIRVESEPGKGSVFTIELPLK